jgi:hypothetical protein
MDAAATVQAHHGSGLRGQRYLVPAACCPFMRVVLSVAKCGITLFIVAHFAAATTVIALRVPGLR